ncbi:MAG TPA: hypothetical protein VK550_36565 [Polyangiaceae bacterium]|nr:hypothetical protein [Polyangiaceae bacterium]
MGDAATNVNVLAITYDDTIRGYVDRVRRVDTLGRIAWLRNIRVGRVDTLGRIAWLRNIPIRDGKRVLNRQSPFFRTFDVFVAASRGVFSGVAGQRTARIDRGLGRVGGARGHEQAKKGKHHH